MAERGESCLVCPILRCRSDQTNDLHLVREKFLLSVRNRHQQPARLTTNCPRPLPNSSSATLQQCFATMGHARTYSISTVSCLNFFCSVCDCSRPFRRVWTMVTTC